MILKVFLSLFIYLVIRPSELDNNAGGSIKYMPFHVKVDDHWLA